MGEDDRSSDEHRDEKSTNFEKWIRTWVCFHSKVEAEVEVLEEEFEAEQRDSKEDSDE